jgi:hypothetical protein
MPKEPYKTSTAGYLPLYEITAKYYELHVLYVQSCTYVWACKVLNSICPVFAVGAYVYVYVCIL